MSRPNPHVAVYDQKTLLHQSTRCLKVSKGVKRCLCLLLPVSSAVKKIKQNRSVAKTVGKARKLPAALLCIGLMTTLFLGKTMQTKVKIHLRIQDISGICQPEWNTDLLSLFCCILSLPSRFLNTELLLRTCNCHVVHLHQKHPVHPRSICLLSLVAKGQ